jgi:DNA modification methylase
MGMGLYCGGNNKDMIQLLKGDCLELMKTIPDGSVDAVITDPPYGTTACKWDSVIDFELMWEQLNRIIKPNGAIVLFGSEPFSSALRMSNIKNYKYDWYWSKNRYTNFLNAKHQPMRGVETISIFYFKKPTFNAVPFRDGYHQNFSNNEGKKLDGNYGSHIKKSCTKPKKIKSAHDCLFFDVVHQQSKEYAGHSTQKPIALMEYLIKTYTNENETVLDFTMGSGTTGVACKQTGRNFIGIEMDENYYNIATERINGILF